MRPLLSRVKSFLEGEGRKRELEGLKPEQTRAKGKRPPPLPIPTRPSTPPPTPPPTTPPPPVEILDYEILPDPLPTSVEKAEPESEWDRYRNAVSTIEPPYDSGPDSLPRSENKLTHRALLVPLPLRRQTEPDNARITNRIIVIN